MFVWPTSIVRDVAHVVRANAKAHAYTSCCILDTTRDILVPIISFIRQGVSVAVAPFLDLMAGQIRQLEDGGHWCYILDDNSEMFIPTTLKKICQSPGTCSLFVTPHVVRKNPPAIAYLYQLAEGGSKEMCRRCTLGNKSICNCTLETIMTNDNFI